MMANGDSKGWGKKIICACGAEVTVNREGEAYCKVCSALWIAGECPSEITGEVPPGAAYAMNNGRAEGYIYPPIQAHEV